MENIDSIALIGGGPAALFVLKHLLSEKVHPKTLYIFEKNNRLGAGMPYSKHGANQEHVANVSANELPELYENLASYIDRMPANKYPDFVKNGNINEYEVIPRLILGDYLEEQFNKYINLALKSGIDVKIHTEKKVQDISKKDNENYSVLTEDGTTYPASKIIICTGHSWPQKNEKTTKNWFDSPYPPSKFTYATNYPVAIRGTSLTAVDAIKTLTRLNGKFITKNDEVIFEINEESKNFSLTLFSKRSFLPALRFHTEGDLYSEGWIMSEDEIYDYKKTNGGFVDLDYVFNLNFKQPLRKKNEKFYQEIKDLSIEEFVEKMLTIREELDSFELFKAEYSEAQKSIDRHESVAWKEALSAFSYAINYPAKHFSAEDMLRFRKTLLPLISVIIASLPQSSYREIIALYNAGIIQLVSVDDESYIEPHDQEGAVYHYTENGIKKNEHYRLYIDAIGQQPVQFNNIPFEGLKEDGLISSGYIKFKDNAVGNSEYQEDNTKVLKIEPDHFYLRVDGLNINDYFQAVDYYGKATEDLFIMAVPYIAGLNPDYSGLDFCDTAGKRVVKAIAGKQSEV